MGDVIRGGIYISKYAAAKHDDASSCLHLVHRSLSHCSQELVRPANPTNPIHHFPKLTRGAVI